jgi:hypothetical protein
MAAFQAARDCWRLPQAIGWVPMAWAEEARAFGAQIPPRQERPRAGTFGLGMIEAANAPFCPVREADVRVPCDMLAPGDALENLPKSSALPAPTLMEYPNGLLTRAEMGSASGTSISGAVNGAPEAMGRPNSVAVATGPLVSNNCAKRSREDN